MKFADINKRFTEVVAEYIAKGYVIHTTTMNGSQGETAKVDLTNGKEVIRVMLDTRIEPSEYYYNTFRLTIGRCKDKIKINKNGLHDIIWNGHLEIISMEKFYQIGEYDSSFFGTIDDVRSQHKKHKERLAAGYAVRYLPFRGVSMLPMLRQGKDSVVLSRIDGEPKKYDVVLYTGAKNRYTMHRIIGIRENEYLIRGDNTYRVEHIPKENIIGILTEFNRKGKRHSTEETAFKIYSRVWNFIYPIRFVCFKAYVPLRRFAGRVYHKIIRK